MAQQKQTPPLRLPADLVEFLAGGLQLEYDPAECEAGAVTLLPLAALRPERFPVETGNLANHKDDPHHPGVNSYLVLGVNLTAACSGDYNPVGLLLWLPLERRYGIWDCSHCGIQVFDANVTWADIVAAPARYLNAGWSGMDPASPPVEDLVPWPNHPYGDGQVYAPQPP